MSTFVRGQSILISELIMKSMKTLQAVLIVIATLFWSCDKTDKIEKDESSGVGTCVPIMKPTEFIFLSWYELIDISADNLLDRYKDTAAGWRLQKLKEAGFNTYFDYRLNSLDEAEALLSMGDTVGMKIIVECPELHTPTQTQKAVEAMSAHPSLYAYNVWDEPELFEYPEVIRRIKEIYKYDKERPCYVNLFPNYGWDDWVEDKYLETLRHYLKTIPVSFLSFDYYPVIMENGVRTTREAWYHNLEDIRTAAKEANVPIWSFALAKLHANYPKPTLADLRLQHFSNLVYGAVAFQYFTTITIVRNNAVTDIYPLVKQVNEELKLMENIFLGADIKDIWHTGKTIPRGTRELTALPAGINKIETGDEGTVVSYFTNKGKQYIAFVNKSCTEDTTLQIEFSGSASNVAKDGTETPAVRSYNITAGDILIFTW